MDVLDLLDSNEEAFAEKPVTTKAAKAPVKKSKYDTPYDPDFSKRKSIQDDSELEAKQVDTTKFKSIGRFFSINVHKGESGIPETVKDDLVMLTKALMDKGIVMRYNGDNDAVYEKMLGGDLSKVEMYLPWKKFNTDFTPKMAKPNDEAFHYAAYYHKGYAKLPGVVRTFLARDMHLLLGEGCNNPSKFLLCYSDDGAECIKDIKFEKTGKLSYCISVCDLLDIPVFNLGNDNAKARLIEFVKAL